jgi:hypothetical protein
MRRFAWLWYDHFPEVPALSREERHQVMHVVRNDRSPAPRRVRIVTMVLVIAPLLYYLLQSFLHSWVESWQGRVAMDALFVLVYWIVVARCFRPFGRERILRAMRELGFVCTVCGAPRAERGAGPGPCERCRTHGPAAPASSPGPSAPP